MSMAWRIFRFELRRLLGRPGPPLGALLFFALGFAALQLWGGAFDRVRIAFLGGMPRLNSPYLTHLLLDSLSLLGLVPLAALVGGMAQRDARHRMIPLVWTTGVSRGAWWWGRFAAAFLVAAALVSSLAGGLWLSSRMPWLEPALLGPDRAWTYLHPLLLTVLPRLLFAAAVIYTVTARQRSTLPGYLAAAVLFAAKSVAGRLAANLEDRSLAGLLDPSGSIAWRNAVRYWSIEEKNGLLVPLDWLVLGNRLLWVGLGLALLTLAGLTLRFADESPVRRLRPGRLRRLGRSLAETLRAARFPRAWTARLPLVVRMAGGDYGRVVRNPAFLLTLGVSLAVFTVSLRSIGRRYGTPSWPVTYQVTETLGALARPFFWGMVIFFSGHLAWHDRRVRMAPLIDATPASPALFLGSRLLALLGLAATLQLALLPVGLAFQAAQGFTGPRLAYLSDLLGIQLAGLALVAALACALTAMLPYRVLGYLTTLAVLFAAGMADAVGLDHVLYRFGQTPGIQYSDLNGYGAFLAGWLTLTLYWSCAAALLLLAAFLFWPRGENQGWPARRQEARLRLTPRVRRAGAGLAAAFLGLGGWIFYNTNVLHPYRSRHAGEAQAAANERQYRPWLERSQPRIIATRLEVDLEPRAGRARLAGTSTLRNGTAGPISEILLRLDERLTVARLEFDRPAALAPAEGGSPYRVAHLARPLLPGEELRLTFDTRLARRGFANRESGTGILPNGTFLSSSLLPGVGYDPAGELTDPRRRRRHGLPEREPLPPPSDAWGRAHSLVSVDADWMRFEAVVSTDADQVALAPGDLVREWRRGGRRYFHYRSAVPVLDFFAFVSGRYAVHRGSEGEVELAIYHHPSHAYNVEAMMRGLAAGLAHFSAAYGPYPHRVLRIVEVPRAVPFAQAFPTVIPFSETLGFLARRESPDDLDHPFYVTVHEVAHQWWGHHVAPARTAGATLLLESFSQWSALRVMEDRYGKAAMAKFLRHELDRYLVGRGIEERRELPLLAIQDQAYLHYNKGALATYTLDGVLGREAADALLAEWSARFGRRGPPYPTAADFRALLAERVPPAAAPAVADLFERITFHDLRIEEARCRPLAGGGFRVTLDVRAAKSYAGADGKTAAAPLAEPVEVGLFGKRQVLRKTRVTELLLERPHLRTGRRRLELTVEERPERAVLDPYFRKIDRAPDDNSKELDCG